MSVVHIPSETDPSVSYAVDTDTGACTCAHYQKRLKGENEADQGERRCKHYRLALAREATPEERQP